MADTPAHVQRPGTQERVTALKLVIIGKSGAGKTALLRSRVAGKADTLCESTVGVDYRNVLEKVNGRCCKIAIYDTSGQEKFGPISASYVVGSAGLIIVISLPALCKTWEDNALLAGSAALEPAALIDREFATYMTWVRDAHLEGKLPIVVVGSKTDLLAREPIECDFRNALALRCAELGYPYVDVSSRLYQGVREAFAAMYTAIEQSPSARDRLSHSASPQPPAVDLRHPLVLDNAGDADTRRFSPQDMQMRCAWSF